MTYTSASSGPRVGVGMISRRHASRGAPNRFCRTTYACMRVGTSPTGGRSPRSYRSAMSPPVSLIFAVGAPSRPPAPDVRLRLAAELLYQSGQARVVEPGLAGLVERRAVEEPRVALLELASDGRVRAGDGEGLDHLVGDQVGHARPVTLDGLPVERGREVLPAVGGEHGLIGARRRVEGDLLLDRAPALRELLLGVAEDDERRGDVGEALALPARRAEPLVDGGLDILAQILRAVERVDVQAVAYLARDPAHVPVHARDVHGNLGVRDGPRVEERRHQVEAVEPALDVEPGPVLPAVPDG